MYRSPYATSLAINLNIGTTSTGLFRVKSVSLHSKRQRHRKLLRVDIKELRINSMAGKNEHNA